MLETSPRAPAVAAPTGRLPDFFVLGPGKSGTTTVHRWLAAHPDVHVDPSQKEIHFFSHDPIWCQGLDWYASLFAVARPDQVVGDCTIHARPDAHPDTATRMASACPRARLVFLVRDPVERLRSHYRHEVQRGRERERFAVAVETNPVYVQTSLYASLAEPFDRAFPADQLLCVRLASLNTSEGWERLLSHVGASPRARPTDVLNTTSAKPQYSPTLRWLWDRGLVPSHVRAPSAVRSLARRVLLRPPTDPRYRALLLSSEEDPLPPRVRDLVARDHDAFEADHAIH